jgi:hypothetical protein
MQDQSVIGAQAVQNRRREAFANCKFEVVHIHRAPRNGADATTLSYISEDRRLEDKTMKI